jgi:hypothetical protein
MTAEVSGEAVVLSSNGTGTMGYSHVKNEDALPT